MGKIALAIHGGAGTIDRSAMTPELEAEYRGALEAALRAGWQILESGGWSLDAVEAAVVSLEDFPLFNAGRGSVFTSEGKNEMDAAIMDGSRLNAGAIAFVRNVKNPVSLARLVMERTEHVLLAGNGAIQFAKEMQVEFRPDDYFFTQHRWNQLQEAIAAGRVQLDHAGEIADCGLRIADFSESYRASTIDSQMPDSQADDNESAVHNPQSAIKNSTLRTPHSKGTVGAVASDLNGNLAAATSTGGMTNKKFGRVGDTAIIGSGTYADDICAVSCTGHGEFFMLGVTAHDLAARMKYKSLSLEDAANETVERLTSIGGEGGLIAVDSHGHVVLPFNSDGMYRGFMVDGRSRVEIYR